MKNPARKQGFEVKANIGTLVGCHQLIHCHRINCQSVRKRLCGIGGAIKPIHDLRLSL